MKIFQREQRSLFGEILDWMLTPLLVVWPASMVLTWLVAQSIADKPFDRALEYNTLVLAQLVSVQQGKASFNLPAPAREILRADEDDVVYHQVLGARAEVLSGERDLPKPDSLPEVGRVQLRDDELRGESLRIAWVYIQPGELPAGSAPLLVQVAETREKRSRLAAEIVKGVLLPQFVVLPLAVFLIWLALARGIRPLHELEERIRARRSDDLSPIDTQAVPAEVAPLVNSVNDLFARERQALAGQKRFLADAAHQLKTPLAGLRMQADLALRAHTSEAELKQSLQHISRSSIRATRTVNQLLSLARAEGGIQSLQRARFSVAAVVIEAVQDMLPRAMEKNLDLGYDGASPADDNAFIEGYPTLLAELVKNLVDNALSYVPSSPERQGVITARVLSDAASDVVLLQVEDNGYGIPLDERELVLQPFYRRLGPQSQEVDGSGLGLAIVSEIAARHQGLLSIEECDAQDSMPGVRFHLRLPKKLSA